jgi:2,3-bisphosphoglycerate-independent phosphoglycerate mutase
LSLTPVCLLILDGWGLAPDGRSRDADATALASTPNLDRLAREYPFTRLACSGAAVGLPDGVIGNSEVGHITIGAGRRVYQDLSRIDAAMDSGELAANPVLARLVRAAEAGGGALHLLGLLSDAGVHAHTRHLKTLIQAASAQFAGDIRVHLFTDGRDSPPGMALGLAENLETFLEDYPKARVASVIGRFYAMDRDQRFERTRLAYRALVYGEGKTAASSLDAIRDALAAGETDEFITPRLIPGPDGRFTAIGERDAALFFNYRADRARQMTQALTDPGFAGFDRGSFTRPALFAGLTEYEATWDLPALFAPKQVANCLGEMVAKAGLDQLRLAETEKYAHVTYFLNCGRETPFPGEERVLIPSPREVATYDLKPEMSVYPVRDAFLAKWATRAFAFAAVNLANADMVGHTGSLDAARRACEAVDDCLGAMAEAVLASGGCLIVTADHGNAEEMRTPDGRPMTAHTRNEAPCILVSDAHKGARLRPGELSDLAPTLLALAGLDKPAEMTGNCLIVQPFLKAAP